MQAGVAPAGDYIPVDDEVANALSCNVRFLTALCGPGIERPSDAPIGIMQ
jgi:hypothetical protein